MTEKLDKYVINVDYDSETGEEHTDVLKTDGTDNMGNWETIVSTMYCHHSIFENIVTELNKLYNYNKELEQEVEKQDGRKWACLKQAHSLELKIERLKETNQKLYDELQETTSFKSLKTAEVEQLKKENDELKQLIKKQLKLLQLSVPINPKTLTVELKNSVRELYD